MRDRDTVLLEKTYELIMEMPHVKFVIDGQEALFDLRIEKHSNDWEGLVLSTREFLNSFREKKSKARKYFFRELSRYPNVELFFSKFYNKTLGDFEKAV